MRIIESLILVALFLSTVLLFINVSKRPKWAHFFPSATILLIILHVLTEGNRWQMVPAYTLAIMVFVFTLGNLKIAMKPRSDEVVHDRKWFRFIRATLSLFLLIFSVSLPVMISVMVLPDPTGPYAIGTKYFHFIDNNKQEGFMSEVSAKREIVAQAWYPANPVPNAKPEPYWENAGELSAIFAKRLSSMMEMVSRILNNKAMPGMKLPSYWFSHNSLTKTHSYPDAPISSDKPSFPLLIFSHGFFLCPNNFYTAFMEELASHGYIVFSIAHAYDVPFFIYPDKTVKDFSARNEQLLKLFGTCYEKHFISLVEKLKETRNPSEQIVILKEINSKRTGWSQGVRIRIADVGFLIDELEKMNREEGMFVGKLDLDRLGVLGMSFGGTTAYGACLVDRRCKAGVSMDGFIAAGNMLEAGPIQPFMFMLSEENRGVNDFFYNNIKNAAYMVTIEGTAHLNYTDESLVGGLSKLTGQLGGIDGNRCVRIINDYVLAFFDKHLRKSDSGFLNSPSSEYPEVEFKSRNE